MHRRFPSQRSQNRGLPLHLGVEFLQHRFDISAVVRVRKAFESLDILLRHRLLPQPGGFEGLALVRPESLSHGESVNDFRHSAKGSRYRRTATSAFEMQAPETRTSVEERPRTSSTSTRTTPNESRIAADNSSTSLRPV